MTMLYKALLLELVVVAVLVQIRESQQVSKDDESAAADRPAAQKRNLLQFGLMVNCATGRFPLDYNNYGNYCGFGGSGIPVDDVDRCCKAHDECYGRYEHCSPYFIHYTFDRNGSYPNCKITCGDTDPCKKAVCTCDKEAAECFARSEYNPENKNIVVLNGSENEVQLV